MILGIQGSPRRGGNSQALLKAILQGVAAQGEDYVEVRLVDYRFDPCVGCEQCRKDKICTRLKDGMTLLYPLILEARGLVLVSPVHNYNVTAWMKAFLDRMYCFYDFQDDRPRSWSSRLAGQGRKAVVACIGEQAEEKDMGFTLEAMEMPLAAMGYEVLEKIMVKNVFDRGMVRKRDGILKTSWSAGETLAKALA